VISKSDSRRSLIDGSLYKPFDAAGAIEQTIVGMVVEVNEGHLIASLQGKKQKLTTDISASLKTK
jgi:hypothetical protein